MATIKYSIQPRTLSEAGFPVFLIATIIGICTPALMQAGLTQSPDTVAHQDSRDGREQRWLFSTGWGQVGVG